MGFEGDTGAHKGTWENLTWSSGDWSPRTTGLPEFSPAYDAYMTRVSNMPSLKGRALGRLVFILGRCVNTSCMRYTQMYLWRLFQLCLSLLVKKMSKRIERTIRRRTPMLCQWVPNTLVTSGKQQGTISSHTIFLALKDQASLLTGNSLWCLDPMPEVSIELFFWMHQSWRMCVFVFFPLFVGCKAVTFFYERQKT